VGKTDYQYDTNGPSGRGNLTKVEYWNNNPVNPETPIIEKHYDAYGNMDWAEDALNNRTTYVYDSEVHTFPVTITNALGHTVTNTWDYNFGKKLTGKDPNDKIISNTYDKFRRLTQTDYPDYPDGGQSLVDYTYLDDENEFPRYIKASVKEKAGGFIDSWKYIDGLGRKIQNVTKGEDNQYVVSRTDYDQMGRAYRAEGPYFSSVRDYYSQNPPQNSFPWAETTGTYPAISYSYNTTGNIMSRTVGTDTYSYTYDTNNKPHAVKSINGNNYAYDSNGNMTTNWDFTNPSQVAQRTIAYTADNMPKTITHQYNGTTTYKYDGGAVRAKKEVSGGSTTHYVSGDYEITAGVATRFIFAGNLRIAMVKGSDTHYFHKDHLGSSTVITDDTGAVAEQTLYMPFGGMRTHSGTTVSGYKFTGQELDPESGLYNYNARLYDPMIGMFITPDSLVPDFTNPQCLNRYAYCVNSPLMYVDPSGQFFGIDDLIIGALIGSLIGGVTSAITGGDIGMGMLTGAISGAIFGAAGGFIEGAKNAGIVLSSVMKAGIHMAAGGLSGGISAGITDSDVGLGILTGAVSGGIAKYAGEKLFGAGKFFGDSFGRELAGRTVIGGVTGGISSEIYGGSFSEGFIYGAKTGAIGFMCNDVVHDLIEGRYLGTYIGEKSALWYAQKYNQTGKWHYAVGGCFASLWSPNTWYKTTAALATAGYLNKVDTVKGAVIFDLAIQLYTGEQSPSSPNQPPNSPPPRVLPINER